MCRAGSACCCLLCVALDCCRCCPVLAATIFAVNLTCLVLLMDDVIPYTVNLRKNPPVYLPFYGLRHGGRTSFESCRSTGNGIPGHRAVSPCFPCLLRLEELISFPIPSTGLPLYGLSYCGQTRCELCPWTENGISRLAGTL